MTAAARCAWVVIPAFNEGRMIARVVAEVVSAGFQTVVIDDGSADDTAAVANAAGAWVLQHPVNLGQGAGLQTGIEFALSRGATEILTLDADGQHQATDLHLLLEPLRNGTADFALGSRFLGSTVGAPTSRKALLKLATWFTRLSSGMALTDAHNGLRGMTGRGARRIDLRQNRMAHASEILEQIGRSGLPWVEVPVTIHYTDYSLTKGQTMSDSVNILLDLFARTLRQ